MPITTPERPVGRGRRTRPDGEPGLVCVLLVLLLSAAPLHAAICVSVAACNASLPAGGCSIDLPQSWTCGHVPRSGDKWTVNTGHTVRIDRPDVEIGGSGWIGG